MDPQLFGAIVDKIIPLAGGLLATYLGFRPLAQGAASKPASAQMRVALRVLGPLLVVWSLGSLVLVVLASKGGSERAAVVAGINARMPTMADEVTRIERLEDRGDKLVYHATLLTITSNPGLAAGALDTLAAAARANICGQAEQRGFLEALGPIRTEFTYADGPAAGGYEIGVHDCQAPGAGGTPPR
jgi:hypothetical protein